MCMKNAFGLVERGPCFRSFTVETDKREASVGLVIQSLRNWVVTALDVSELLTCLCCMTDRRDSEKHTA